MKKPFEPNFNTPEDQYSKEEINKLNSNAGIGSLPDELRDCEPNLSWEAEQLAKSQGVYLEFNRAKSGKEKDWMYMIRFTVPGGGPITREQYNMFHDVSEKYTKNPEGVPSIRLTTRQTIQLHWIKKENVIPCVKAIAEKGLRSLNACGDNTRNVMTCPLSKHSDILNTNGITKKIADYFELPAGSFIKIFEVDTSFVNTPEKSFSYGPKLLNRKFKIGFSSIFTDASGSHIPDNCVEVLTNDLAIVPILENGKVDKLQVYVGGGQGERNGKPSMATLAIPLTITTEDKLIDLLDAIVTVHKNWGDRQNRHWARLKYVIKKQGIDWFREKVSEQVGYTLEKPITDYDYGDRHLHHGWYQQPSNGLWAYGMYIENGRIIDNGPNGKLKSLIHHLMNTYNIEASLTANQDIIFMNIPDNQKDQFEKDLVSFGYGQRNGKEYSALRKHSGACVGRDTCRLTYTDSEKFEPELIDELEKLGWGHLQESVGITGCERQCFRPSTKTIGLVGTGLNRYQLRLFGDRTGRFQGKPLISSDGEQMYLRSVPREEVATAINVLFKFYQKNKSGEESIGEFFRVIGADAIINHLKENPKTTELMQKPFNTDCIIE